MTRPVIRPILDADVEGVVGLALGAWEPVFASMRDELGAALFLTLYPDGWRVQQERDVRDACADKTTFVAQLGEELAGFVAVDTNSDDVEGEIHMIAVDPAHQRRGVGAMLLASGIDQVRSAGLPVVRIGTGGDVGHAPARALYERFGLTPLPVIQYFRVLSDEDHPR